MDGFRQEETMLSRWIKAVDVSAIALAVLCGVGSILFFVVRPLGAFSLLHVHWSDPRILLWDTLLSLAFFLQHSGMNRQGFRSWLSRSVAPRYHGAIYSIASGVVLILLIALWQASDTNVLVLEGLARSVAQLVSLVALGLFIWSTMALMTFDPLGLRPIAAHLRGRAYVASPLVIRGAYRWVRHPLYSCVIAMLWTAPNVTLDRLLFNVLWTAWIVVGSYLEERDLCREFGDGYREYQRNVPMLVPWPGHSAARWIPARAGE
jgi:methanethiol S-methyltransferase